MFHIFTNSLPLGLLLGIIFHLEVAHTKISLSVNPPSPAGLERLFTSFVCNVDSPTEMSLQWKKGNTVLTRGHHHVIKVSNGLLLRIGPLKKRKDETEYTCVATDKSGEVFTKTTTLKVYNADTVPEGFPSFLQQPQQRVATVGMMAVMNCKVEGDPSPTVSWRFDYKPIDVSLERYSITPTGSLKIKNVQIDVDQGLYECVATNSHGVLHSRRATLFLRAQRIPPKFTEKPVNQTVDPEDDVSLKCAASGVPRPTLLWDEDGSRLLGGGDGTLVINKIEKSAKYTCMAVNSLGSPKTHAYITVRPLPFSPTMSTHQSSDVTAESITISWLARPGGTPPVNTYTIFHRQTGKQDWEIIRGIRSTKTSWTFHQLQPHTKYEFMIYAVNDLGQSKPSPVSTVKTKEKAPGSPPFNIKSRGMSSTSFRAEWTPPLIPNGDIDGYRLYYTTNTNTKFEKWRFVATATNETTVYGLAKLTTYTFKVLAYTSGGDGPLSYPVAVKTQEGVPGQPQNVRIKVMSSTSLEVSWASPSYVGLGIVGYEVRYNVSSSLLMDGSVTVFDSLSAIVTGLKPYRVYEVGVAARSARGYGPLSFTLITRTESGIPTSPPQNVQAISQDSTSIKITWLPPLSGERNGIITMYTIRYCEWQCKSKTEVDSQAVVDVPGSTNSTVLSDLKTFTEYTIWVSASTVKGQGPAYKFTTQTDEDVPSGAPRRLKATVLNSTAIELNWRPPSASEQDGIIRGFMVFYSKVIEENDNWPSENKEFMKDSGSEKNLRVLLMDLEPATNYKMEVAAYTVKGDGQRSIPAYATTLTKRPDPPFVHVKQQFPPVLAWKPTVRGVMRYKVVYGKAIDKTDVDVSNPPFEMIEEIFNADTTEHQFDNLNHGVYYLFKVSLETDLGWSGARWFWIYTLPSAPTGPPQVVKPTAVSSTSIALSWDEPDLWVRNGPITGYFIKYWPSARTNEEQTINVTGLQQTSIIISGLDKSSEYTFTVRARTVVGPGPFSPASTEITKEDAPDSPPRDVNLKALGTSIIALKWKKPSKPNGEITLYSIAFRSTEKDNWNVTTVDSTNVPVYNLERNKRYWFKVAASTGVGIGPYSAVQSIRTLKHDVPKECKNVKVSEISSLSALLKWDPPDDTTGITGYLVKYSGKKIYRDSSNKETQLEDSNELTVRKETFFRLTDLQPSLDYSIEVEPVSSLGNGPATSFMFTTEVQAPPPMEQIKVEKYRITYEYIPVRLEPASDKNGPISYYLLIVVPLGKINKISSSRRPEDFLASHNQRRRRDIDDSEKGEEIYVAAKFLSNTLPNTFNVGNRTSDDGYYNKPLVLRHYYSFFLRAYVKSKKGEMHTSSRFSSPVRFWPSGVPYDSDEADVRAQADENDSTGTPMTWIAAPLVILVLLVVVVVIIFILHRRRKKLLTMKRDSPQSEPADPVEMKRLAIRTPAMMDHPPIPVSELAVHISMLRADNNEKFHQEYESIEGGQNMTYEHGLSQVNKAKNRYSSILPYDQSRVMLASMTGIPGSDYINANFMDGYRKENAYIATQAPLLNTMNDFWRMVWEQRSAVIVMLTKLEERGKLKCDFYWPEEESDIFGDVHVTIVDQLELANYTLRTFQLQRGHSPETREVKHFQFTAWPVHGVPSYPTPMLAFMRKVKNNNPPDAGPLIVHCSAGVGRSGCYIVIDSMLERLKYENSVDIYGHVTVLRAQRSFMVQSEEQYMFIHDAILEAVTCGNTEVHARNLLSHIKRLQDSEEGETSELEEEFKRLNNPQLNHLTRFVTANLPVNKYKNRLVNILPYEGTRVHLTPIRGVEGSNYINANFIDGYREKRAFIATQAPMMETVDDLWRMIIEHNSPIIVMLTQLREMSREKCYQYWPTDRSVRYHYYVVDLVLEQEYPHYIYREFKVTDARDGDIRTVRMFHFTSWPEMGVPPSGEGIIDLIGQVNKVRDQLEYEAGPITVHCSAGVGRTGIFCALSIVLERMRAEGVVDLFQTVKLLRTQRPAMVQIEDQYLFCYKVALEFLGSFDHYAI